MPLRPTFNIADMEAFFTQQFGNASEAVFATFQFAGESFVRAARLTDTYQDITGNLRSSIGYIILNNGKQVLSDFTESERGTDRVTGVNTGELAASDLSEQYPKGLILICVAGMDYAAAVEAKNYDVITNASLEVSKLLKQQLQAL